MVNLKKDIPSAAYDRTAPTPSGNTAAADLFDGMREALGHISDCRKAYRMMGHTFRLCLDMHTDFAGLRFGGPFAQTDYLLKEHNATAHLRMAVNGARTRFRRQSLLSDSVLEANAMHDWKAVCRFIALVCGVSVPQELEAVFPDDVRREAVLPKAEYLRVVVNSWDDTTIYANADDVYPYEVRVRYAGNGQPDHAYIGKLLSEGCQLNLIRPKEDNGVLLPELIILEPDYLVDISAVAACFESYSRSPLIHLLNKFRPQSASEHIVLGNMAGQMLDEELCTPPEENTYRRSAVRFFRDNAIAVLTAGLSPSFHKSAEEQKRNIRYALREVLPRYVSGFRPADVMVEPSFFSEMLGLQGRMDFLQLDHRVLIEQKSGNGGFPQRYNDTPVVREKHYVQLLLYMLLIRYNYRRTYEENRRNLQAFLLYSKYRNGLISIGFSPELAAEAIEVRNGIAAAEYGYTRGGIGILRRLTAESMKTKNIEDRFWKDYQKPQLEEVLQPFRTASPLEWAYVRRMLTFIETEHLLAKVGCRTKEDSGFADKWHGTLDDKLQSGSIFHGLELLSPSGSDSGKVERVVLRFGRKTDDDVSNFRTGDVVILYPYAEGDEPDARCTMVFRGTIEDIAADTVTVGMRAAQTDAWVFHRWGRCLWAVEHDFIESSFASLYRSAYVFLQAPQERKDLLLLQRSPRHDDTAEPAGDYGDFNELVRRVCRAQDFFIIIGPPGTGKTSFGLLNTVREELLRPGTDVLLLSYTNRAVDEICSKLAENGIDYIRIGSRYSCDRQYRDHLLDVRAARCRNADELRQLIRGMRVFTGTTSACSGAVSLLGIKRFSLTVIDEASQILEPHLLRLLCARTSDGNTVVGRFVLIGDHKQLPAVVLQREDESRVEETCLRDIHLTDCRMSLFERLLRRYRDDPDVVYMLTRQGRMHREIARFPNTEFYGGKLREVPCAHQTAGLPSRGKGLNGIDDILTTRRVAFVEVERPEKIVSDKVNGNEAEAIAATVVRIYGLCGDTFDALTTVGVIVPYRNQIAAVRNAIARYGIDCLRAVTIDTVERYQGSQRDYIIYGFTIQKHYQLKFLTNNVFEEDGSLIDRKLNVAMTRAREHLLLFGNTRLLTADRTFLRLTDFIRERGGYFSVPLRDYVDGRFHVPPS